MYRVVYASQCVSKTFKGDYKYKYMERIIIGQFKTNTLYHKILLGIPSFAAITLYNYLTNTALINRTQVRVEQKIDNITTEEHDITKEYKECNTQNANKINNVTKEELLHTPFLHKKKSSRKKKNQR